MIYKYYLVLHISNGPICITSEIFDFFATTSKVFQVQQKYFFFQFFNQPTMYVVIFFNLSDSRTLKRSNVTWFQQNPMYIFVKKKQSTSEI